MPNDASGAERLFRRLLQRLPDMCGSSIVHLLQEADTALRIVRDGSKGLVELMRKRRGHLYQFILSCKAGEFALHFLQSSLRFLSFGEIADEPRKEPSGRRSHFADREFHGKGGAVLPSPDDNTIDADNLFSWVAR